MPRALLGALVTLVLAIPAAAQDPDADGRRCLAYDTRQRAAEAEAALQACTAAIDSGQAPERVHVSLFYTRGMILSTHRRDYRGAIDDYTRAIRASRTPGLTAGIHVQRAVAELALGQYDNAVRDLTIGLEHADLPAPLRPLAHSQRGIAKMLMVLKKELAGPRAEASWREAEADLDRAIALSPADARALYARGVLRKIDGRLEAAEADIAAARRLDPTVPPVMARMGIVAPSSR